MFLDAFRESLEKNGIKSYTMIEIIHVSLTAYDWDKGIFDGTKVIEKIKSKIPRMPSTLVISIFSPEVEYNGTYPECMVRENLVLFSIGNLMRRGTIKDPVSYIRDNISRFIRAENCITLN